MTSRRQNQQHSRRKGWESLKVFTSADNRSSVSTGAERSRKERSTKSGKGRVQKNSAARHFGSTRLPRWLDCRTSGLSDAWTVLVRRLRPVACWSKIRVLLTSFWGVPEFFVHDIYGFQRMRNYHAFERVLGEVLDRKSPTTIY